jgi:hypothetical protein
MINELSLEKDMEVVVSKFKVLSRNLLGGIEKNHGKPQA